MKKYKKAKELLEIRANKKEKKPIYATRKLSIGLVSCMLGLVIASPVVRAENQVEKEVQPETEQIETKLPEVDDKKETPDTEGETPNKPQNELIQDENQTELGDELGISPEEVPEAVKQGTIEAPSINKVFYGDKSISGTKLHRERVNKKTVRATVHVTLKDKNGGVKAEVSVTPTSGSSWSINLPKGVEVSEGDTITVYQELNGSKSPEVTADAQPSDRDKYKDQLKMPEGEIWIEDTSSSLVSDDEQAEAIDMFNKANSTILKDISSVKFSIDGTAHAYFEVTYTDGSKSGKIEATKLKINTITEKSQFPEIQQTFIADGQITIKLAEKVKAGTKIGIAKNFDGSEGNNFCKGGSCSFTKTTVDWVTVDVDTDTINYKIGDDFLQFGQEFGVLIKEPRKKASCSKSKPELKTPEKTGVRDPKNLTDDEKTLIRAAIRQANTRETGKSKMPDGAGERDGVLAAIQIDDSGNVKIFDAFDVAGDWDDSYNFVPETNEDGSYKVNDGAEPKITIPVKDLVKNLKPDAPKIKHDEAKPEITITPNEKDTDAQKIEITYTGTDGSGKTVTATKDDDGNWTTDDGDVTVSDKGVVTLPTSKIKGGTKITAKVTDIGGLTKEEEPLTSDPGEATLSKAEKVTDLGGLDPVDITKNVGEEVAWKDGVKAKESAKPENKTKIDELLKEATFTDATDKKRTTETKGEFVGKISVRFDDGSEIVVENQKLIVNPVAEKVKVSYDSNGGEGNMEGKELDKGKEYTLLANKFTPPTVDQEFSGWNIGDDKELKQAGYTFKVSGDTVITAIWKPIEYKVRFKPGEGAKGSMNEETVKKGDSFKIPSPTFTPPANKEFAGWKIEGKDDLKQKDDTVDVTGDLTLVATWKAIKVKVTYDANGGEGSMEGKELDKGSKYTLLANGFTAPANKEFAGWKIGDTEYKPDAEITVNEDTTVKAIWKDKSTTPDGGNTNPGEQPDPSPQPKPDPKPGEGGTKPDPKPGEGGTKPDPKPGEDGTKPNPNPGDKEPGKPGVKVPGKDDKTNPDKTSESDKKDKKENDGKLESDVEDRLRIRYNPNGGHWNDKSTDILTYYYDRGNIITLINPPTREGYRFLYWKGSAYQPGDKYTVVDDHMFVAQWEKIGTKASSVNPKTGLESVAGIVCTLVGSTGALYIGRKKED